MAKKVLFIDRDGTLVLEPPVDYQLDSLEKLVFYPEVFQYMSLIASKLDYELVMVSNQDGLGTSSFPTDTFEGPQAKIIQAFSNEGVHFSNIHIDPSMPEDLSPSRKPGIGMLTEYFSEQYDLANSLVIGDRITDIQLAKNLGCKGILIHALESGQKAITAAGLTESCALITDRWAQIYEFLLAGTRTASIRRTTKETDIELFLQLDGTGNSEIETGIHFFDHMLEQIARHSGCDLNLKVKGDLMVDEHHTVEDTALVLGEAFKVALGDKRGIERYGFCLPMDDCLCQAVIDFGGRAWLVWEASFHREMIGQMPTELFHHFFKSFSDSAQCNLNIKAEGVNEHHKIEGIFKALAKAIKMAKKRDVFAYQLPSTKGVL